MKRLSYVIAMAVALSTLMQPALAHVGAGATASLGAGFGHPFSGLDHIGVMVAVGLWAALKGGRAVWVWPASFLAVMLAGGVLGMAGVPVPFVEPAILASVGALGLLVALAVDWPIWIGTFVIGVFAVFHGYAHGNEVPETASGIGYMAGFAIATALLHVIGIAFAFGMAQLRWRAVVRGAGAACVLVGIGLTLNWL